MSYGVCRISVAPLRKEPAHQAEQVSQLLFGEHYEVLETGEREEWLMIRHAFDGYEGWLHGGQHHAVSGDYFSYLNKTEFKITTDLTATLLYNKAPQTILMGSVIPISSAELFKMDEQFAFNGEAKNIGMKRDFDYLRATALKYLSAPYQWGGKSPFGLDCSGFVQMTFKIAGYKLKRDAYQQAREGVSVGSYGLALPGDLAFFQSKSGRIDHVGIMVGRDKIIHCAGRVRIDHLTDHGILNLDTKLFTHELATIRRILPEGHQPG